ncbi:hypothetical protein BVC80_209g266 [Macleaya cordata]|uniref:Programmed cell death protein 4-like n=1 Tax=Macleaya cordata TaxID=56857 RepID=A0A200QDG4_MACCD|nr:hypothetical protein BVC80_209g266 [Macleaya cordata]
MKQGSEKSSGKSHGKSSGSQDGSRKDRRSATGMNGSPKKGGYGGKFTWSGDGGFSPAEVGFVKDVVVNDSKDPNFEDPDDK